MVSIGLLADIIVGSLLFELSLHATSLESAQLVKDIFQKFH
jgi:hypothetical protein